MKLLLIGGTLTIVTAAATLIGFHRHELGLSAGAGGWRDGQRIFASDGADGEHFGHAVALDGDRILVGAPEAKRSGHCTGAAYLFRREGQELSPVGNLGGPEATPLGGFGDSVALCGHLALVGKPSDDGAADESAGAAYLYQEDGSGQWHRLARLVAHDAAAGDRFGNCVALENGIALIGTRGQRHSGAVYVFREEAAGNWRECGKLTPSLPVADDSFGWPIALGGDLAVVGAHTSRQEGQSQAGAAYVFQRNLSGNWQQLAKLTVPDLGEHDFFGRAIAIQDRAILVSACGYANGQAAAYLFREDRAGTWQAVARLTPRNPVPDRFFGAAVAMNDRVIAIGALHENDASGAVYLFSADGNKVPRQTGRITLPGQPSRQWFGVALALSGDSLLVGADCGGGKTPKSGAAYLFPLTAMNPITAPPHLSPNQD